ncbi:DUF2637 domain-containing protein [Streptomyces malaysiense]|uniref:DUF2637 domain-containing protein n=1 Tax=Streptomyces malaysiense TaxID=1428626 RepID=A0A1J4PV67_9ACTN|nr:DUF2637 domain-containing protein [Streptomyces malaysiense]OIK24805.1 hypothetical protein VT52_024710 [Streptomyces malaysiense]
MHRTLIGVVVGGALIIAGIGFAGSYAAVRELALKKGFGNFAYVFPVGIDAGICVLLALDLLLTWIRIPFPLLRQAAWLLTAATIAFNGATAWPDPLGVGMHAVIPILFVVAVEAARHAIGRIADITADKHMEGVRLTRWLLSPLPTFLLWRRMKLWELRSYEQVIKLEQERLVYQARLRSRFGRAWRRKAPVESLMPLRLARYGVPLAETAPSGLLAAGIEPVLLAPTAPKAPTPELTAGAAATAGAIPVAGKGTAAPATTTDPAAAPVTAAADPATAAAPAPGAAPGATAAVRAGAPAKAAPASAPQPAQRPQDPESPQAPQSPEVPPQDEQSPWFQSPREVEYHGGYDPAFEPPPDPQYYPEEQYEDWYEGQPPERFQQPSPEETGSFPIPVGPNRTRELGGGGGTPAAEPDEDAFYQVFRQSIDGSYPTAHILGENIQATYGTQLSPTELKSLATRFQQRHSAELEEDHIA